MDRYADRLGEAAESADPAKTGQTSPTKTREKLISAMTWESLARSEGLDPQPPDP
jgi:hypothetical protein